MTSSTRIRVWRFFTWYVLPVVLAATAYLILWGVGAAAVNAWNNR